MSYRIIDMESYPRRDHFNYFRNLAYPFVGFTVKVDVTDLVRFCRERKWSFYLTFIHVAALSADDVPEFRRRIQGDGIIEYDRCPTSHTELLDNDTYCYCTLEHHMPIDEYISYAEEMRDLSRQKGSIAEGVDSESMYFISSVPWIHFTEMMPPLDPSMDSNPRITWGKYEEDHRGRLMLPVCVFVNHALADGIHISGFYKNIDRYISQFTQ